MEICGKEIWIRGGLVRTAYLDGEGYQFVEDPEAMVEALRKSRTRIDLFTFIQKISDASPKYNYPMEWDNHAALRVSTFDQWMTDQVSSRVRTTIRKTGKDGVVVREVPLDDALLRGISAIYNETPIRQGKRFPHYGKDLETLRKMKATFHERSIFIGAFFNDQLIGFAKLVTDDNRSQAGLMHILSTIQHREKSPTNALIAQAVRSCAERGIPYLWYTKFSFGKKHHDSLAEFKRRNGFRKVEVPRYYVPLTVVGQAALSLGLHRTLLDWVPESMTETYRRIRRIWYARRFPGVENT